jgi:hypothetical protein
MDRKIESNIYRLMKNQYLIIVGTILLASCYNSTRYEEFEPGDIITGLKLDRSSVLADGVDTVTFFFDLPGRLKNVEDKISATSNTGTFVNFESNLKLEVSNFDNRHRVSGVYKSSRDVKDAEIIVTYDEWSRTLIFDQTIRRPDALSIYCEAPWVSQASLNAAVILNLEMLTTGGEPSRKQLPDSVKVVGPNGIEIGTVTVPPHTPEGEGVGEVVKWSWTLLPDTNYEVGDQFTQLVYMESHDDGLLVDSLAIFFTP